MPHRLSVNSNMSPHNNKPNIKLGKNYLEICEVQEEDDESKYTNTTRSPEMKTKMLGSFAGNFQNKPKLEMMKGKDPNMSLNLRRVIKGMGGQGPPSNSKN